MTGICEEIGCNNEATHKVFGNSRDIYYCREHAMKQKFKNNKKVKRI